MKLNHIRYLGTSASMSKNRSDSTKSEMSYGVTAFSMLNYVLYITKLSFEYSFFIKVYYSRHLIPGLVYKNLQNDISPCYPGPRSCTVESCEYMLGLGGWSPNIKRKELSPCHKLWFYNHYIFGTKCCRP